MKKNTQAIFDKNTVEFVTVAAEFCGFLERVSEQKRSQFVDTALKLLQSTLAPKSSTTVFPFC